MLSEISKINLLEEAYIIWDFKIILLEEAYVIWDFKIICYVEISNLFY